MSSFWSDFVKQLEPYTPGEQPDISNITKLNTNENPYGPSPAVLQAISQQLNNDLRLYPPPNPEKLKQTLSDYYQLRPEQVFVGNGSDEVLAHVFNGLLNHPSKGPLLFPDITYSFYPVFCGLYGIDFQKVPLCEDFTVDPSDYLRPNGGIIIANPNAPTGMLLALESIEALLQKNPESVVVIDEAYVDFADESAVTLINQYANLLVVQTLSKSRSLAGMRIGYAMGSEELIAGLERIKNSFNSYPLGHLQIAAAVAAFADEDHFLKNRQLVIDQRQRLSTELQSMGFRVLPSHANFVFACHPNKSAVELASNLRSEGIIVRHFDKPRIESFIRITVGTQSQNDLLLASLNRAVSL
jgi:histidinol-phosphate aminotransferase